MGIVDLWVSWVLVSVLICIPLRMCLGLMLVWVSVVLCFWMGKWVLWFVGLLFRRGWILGFGWVCFVFDLLMFVVTWFWSCVNFGVVGCLRLLRMPFAC